MLLRQQAFTDVVHMRTSNQLVIADPAVEGPITGNTDALALTSSTTVPEDEAIFTAATLSPKVALSCLAPVITRSMMTT